MIAVLAEIVHEHLYEPHDTGWDADWEEIMGYPMSWGRLISRNNLMGNYSRPRPTTFHGLKGEGGPVGLAIDQHLKSIAGDMRRLEIDSMDGLYATREIAVRAGVAPELVLIVLKAFFEGAPGLRPHDPPPDVCDYLYHQSG